MIVRYINVHLIIIIIIIIIAEQTPCHTSLVAVMDGVLVVVATKRTMYAGFNLTRGVDC